MFGSGAFSSPRHPDDYHNNAYCVWHLRSLHDQRVLLEFSYLQYVKIFGFYFRAKLVKNSSNSTTTDYLDRKLSGIVAWCRALLLELTHANI